MVGNAQMIIDAMKSVHNTTITNITLILSAVGVIFVFLKIGEYQQLERARADIKEIKDDAKGQIKDANEKVREIKETADTKIEDLTKEIGEYKKAVHDIMQTNEKVKSELQSLIEKGQKDLVEKEGFLLKKIDERALETESLVFKISLENQLNVASSVYTLSTKQRDKLANCSLRMLLMCFLFARHYGEKKDEIEFSIIVADTIKELKVAEDNKSQDIWRQSILESCKKIQDYDVENIYTIQCNEIVRLCLKENR